MGEAATSRLQRSARSAPWRVMWGRVRHSAPVTALTAGLVVVSGCDGDRAATPGCERINASIFRSDHQDDPAQARASLPGVTVRIYGTDAQFSREPSGEVMYVTADIPGAMQVQRANVVHYFRIAASRVRLSIDGDYVDCDDA